MTPKEKAESLITDFKLNVQTDDNGNTLNRQACKQCVQVLIDELMLRDLSYIEQNYWEKVQKELKSF